MVQGFAGVLPVSTLAIILPVLEFELARASVARVLPTKSITMSERHPAVSMADSRPLIAPGQSLMLGSWSGPSVMTGVPNTESLRSPYRRCRGVHMAASPKGTIALSGGRVIPASDLSVAVYGGGSFGTAMACVLARKGIPAKLVVRRQEVVDQINTNHVNPYYQSDLLLPPLLRATVDPEEAFASADFIFHAVPMQFSRKALEDVKHLIRDDVPVVSLTKGIETSTLCLMSDLIPDVLGSGQPVAFVSGPSFAAEIVNGMATAVTVASADRDLANDVMALFKSASFRALYTPDVVGVEVGGAVKNVIAIAAGMSEGLGLGTNAMAALVTRGCGEMRRLVTTLGGGSSTVFGLSGVGDTFGTCFGPLSRNRQVGYRLGKGEKLEDILESMSQVAEGVATARALTQLVNKRVKGYRKDLKYVRPFSCSHHLCH